MYTMQRIAANALTVLYTIALVVIVYSVHNFIKLLEYSYAQ